MSNISGNKFIGKFKMESQENLDEFLRVLGVNKVKRISSRSASLVSELRFEPETGLWRLTIQISILPEVKNTFCMGKECSWITFDGQNANVLIFLESENKLVAREMRTHNNMEVKYVYETDGDYINMYAMADNVYYSQKLKRLD